MAKGQWKQAQGSLKEAVAFYPKYAAAWYRLGLCYQYENRSADARAAHKKAAAADPKFPPPYNSMALLALQDQDWRAVIELTTALLALDPLRFVGAYYMASVAHLAEGRLEAAEQSARHGLAADAKRSVPKLQHALGLALTRRGDLEAGRKHLSLYLAQEKNASEVGEARRQLAFVENALRNQAAAQPDPEQQK
jgi:tetratricopeptide (TPR) repeat protein